MNDNWPQSSYCWTEPTEQVCCVTSQLCGQKWTESHFGDRTVAVCWHLHGRFLVANWRLCERTNAMHDVRRVTCWMFQMCDSRQLVLFDGFYLPVVHKVRVHPVSDFPTVFVLPVSVCLVFVYSVIGQFAAVQFCVRFSGNGERLFQKPINSSSGKQTACSHRTTRDQRSTSPRLTTHIVPANRPWLPARNQWLESGGGGEGCKATTGLPQIHEWNKLLLYPPLSCETLVHSDGWEVKQQSVSSTVVFIISKQKMNHW